MRALAEMTTIEIAILFHELFHEEIPRFLGYVEQVAKVLIETPGINKRPWKLQTVKPAEWLSLASDIQARIKSERKDLEKYSERFAWKLLTGNNALFMIKCLKDYIPICPDSRCQLAIEAFFEM